LLDGAGLRGLDVDYADSSRDYFAHYASLQVKPRFIGKECQMRIDLTFEDRLWKSTAKRNSATWNARLQGMSGLLLFC
jgi:hypothetical protein